MCIRDRTIGAGTHIGPCVTLKGDTSIGKSCVIGQNTVIEDSNIEDDVEIKSSVITQSAVGSGSKVGPFAYMRPGSHVGRDCKIGDFVEVKNSTLEKSFFFLVVASCTAQSNSARVTNSGRRIIEVQIKVSLLEKSTPSAPG